MLPYVLKDEDPMPYGKYTGTNMGDVSPEYLLWLYENDKCSASVKKYVEKNKHILELQAKTNKKSRLR